MIWGIQATTITSFVEPPLYDVYSVYTVYKIMSTTSSDWAASSLDFCVSDFHSGYSLLELSTVLLGLFDGGCSSSASQARQSWPMSRIDTRPIRA